MLLMFEDLLGKCSDVREEISDEQDAFPRNAHAIYMWIQAPGRSPKLINDQIALLSDRMTEEVRTSVGPMPRGTDRANPVGA
jgi:hypothetical protein